MKNLYFKKYISFFHLRFIMGLQYRAAALAGIVTQFVWGTMEVLVFRAFYQADPQAFPMTLEATTSYIWLQQAFLALFMTWMLENDIFESITNGNISYELCRPIRIYNMWYVRSMAYRLSRAVLRCFPILIAAAFLPAPYGLSAPPSPGAFILFLLTTVLGFLVTVSMCTLVYIICLFTISPTGIRMVFISLSDLLAGSVIPLPFFPEHIRKVLYLLPHASMQNVPLRIYSGDISGMAVWENILLQVFWLAALTALGYFLETLAMKRIVVQGG